MADPLTGAESGLAAITDMLSARTRATQPQDRITRILRKGSRLTPQQELEDLNTAFFAAFRANTPQAHMAGRPGKSIGEIMNGLKAQRIEQAEKQARIEIDGEQLEETRRNADIKALLDAIEHKRKRKKDKVDAIYKESTLAETRAERKRKERGDVATAEYRSKSLGLDRERLAATKELNRSLILKRGAEIQQMDRDHQTAQAEIDIRARNAATLERNSKTRIAELDARIDAAAQRGDVDRESLKLRAAELENLGQYRENMLRAKADALTLDREKTIANLRIAEAKLVNEVNSLELQAGRLNEQIAENRRRGKRDDRRLDQADEAQRSLNDARSKQIEISERRLSLEEKGLDQKAESLRMQWMDLERRIRVDIMNGETDREKLVLQEKIADQRHELESHRVDIARERLIHDKETTDQRLQFEARGIVDQERRTVLQETRTLADARYKEASQALAMLKEERENDEFTYAMKRDAVIQDFKEKELALTADWKNRDFSIRTRNAQTQTERTQILRERLAWDREYGQLKLEADERAAKDTFKHTMTLRKEYNSLPSVQALQQVLPAVEAARNAADTRAGDLNIVFAVGKVFDPDSVVREGEQIMVLQSASIPERVMGWINYVSGEGGKLTAETRGDLINEIENRAKAWAAQYTEERGRYQAIAEESGLDVGLVLGPPLVESSKMSTEELKKRAAGR